MPSNRPAPTLLLVLLTVACGRPEADTRPPEQPGPAPAPTALAADDVLAAADDVAAVTAEPSVAQTISFADDTDPEPATQIQGAPKRPPLPRFRLFGTRDNDGPN